MDDNRIAKNTSPRQLVELKVARSIGLLTGLLLTTLGSPAHATSDSITITADGDWVSWDTTGEVGMIWGLFTRIRHTTPEVSTGWHFQHVSLYPNEASLWPPDGPGVYEVEVCEWDFAEEVLTTCSNSVEITWVHDVNGIFGAIPAADPALETGAITLSANGIELDWDVTGTLGQASGFLLLDGATESWQPPSARDTQWWPAGGLQPGLHELTVCAYDHYRDLLGTCSNPVTVEVATNGYGQLNAVPQPDPADELGTITASLTECALEWETTGTIGATTGFMILPQLGGAPAYGVTPHRYAYPDEASRVLDDLSDAGTYNVAVCAYDFYRNAVGLCSEPLSLDFSWSPEPTCSGPEPEPGPEPGPDPEPEPTPEPAPDAPSEIPPPYSETVAAGLVAWRTPDAEGNSCASCHSPDGIDLAYPAYTRNDILRRAFAHVDDVTANAIADMIEAVRDHYGWVPTQNPREYRPFQPGGQILPGGTPQERDAAFADQLFDMGLIIATGDIDDLATAQLARDELLEVNLWSLPVGIPLDRFSEDMHFGDEHGVLNEWVPNLGHVPNEGEAGTWQDMQDLYLAEPDQSALHDLLDALADPDGPVHLNHADLSGGIESFEAARFRSLLILSHEQRREMAGLAPRGPQDLVPYPTGPMWHTGTLAYETWACDPIHGGELADCMQFPTESLNPALSFFDQMASMTLSWHYVGWLFNQHLQDISTEQSFLNGHYFGLDLKTRGYASHHAFMRVMRSVRKFWGADQSWRHELPYTTTTLPTTSAFADLIFMDQFMAQGGVGGHDLSYGPSAGQHHDRYLRFTANMYKMLLLLLEHEIATTGQVYNQDVLVELLRAEADQHWYGPVDYVPALAAHEPARAAEFQAWIDGIADAAELATEVALAPYAP